MAQFHAVFLSGAAASCAFTHTSTSINNSKPFQTQDLHHRRHKYLKPKIISVFAAVSVDWCEPVLGSPHWWGTVVTAQLPKHWPRQVLLVTSVSLSALSVALLNNIQLSPLLTSRTGAERHRQHLPTVICTISAKDSVHGSPKPQESLPLTPGTLWLVCSHSLLAPASRIAKQGWHVWRWFLHPAAHTGTTGTQVRLWLINNSLQADNSRPCFSSVWIRQLQGTDAWRFVHSFSNTPNVHSALLTPLLFLFPYDPWLQLISTWRQAQLLQIAVMFKLAQWWILEATNKKC